jgi:ceramide glucosyltransferase
MEHAMHTDIQVLFWCWGTAISALTMTYALMACIAVRRRRVPARLEGPTVPVSILKPLRGAEADTYGCLRSFCAQQYPQFQIVFGVSDPNDPVIPIVHRLCSEFPGHDLRLVISRQQHGSNRKVGNLINMLPFARYDNLVIADSDIRVPADYLSRVVAPLADAGVGIVTCSYTGYHRSGIWSLLGSWFINDWFMPSVRVAALSGANAFAFGATIALRRDVLAAIGGLESIADQLADDYRIGERTRRLGLRTVLSEVQVETCVEERTLGQLIGHELRWLRTIRAVQPVGYALSIVTFGVPVAALGYALTHGSPAAACMLAVTGVIRILIHFWHRQPGSAAWHVVLIPFRDALSLVLWCCAFHTRRVVWRGDSFRVNQDGSVQPG